MDYNNFQNIFDNFKFRNIIVNNVFNMDEFEFDDNLVTTAALPILTQYDKVGNDDFFHKSEAKRNAGIVESLFYSRDGLTVKPEKDHLNSFNYLRGRQDEYVNLIYDYTINVLYPVHIGYIGYDEISFPDINNVGELRKAIGVKAIHFWGNSKDNYAYMSISFDFTGDFEHGVNLVFHKNRLLGWEEDLDMKLIEEDLKK